MGSGGGSVGGGTGVSGFWVGWGGSVGFGFLFESFSLVAVAVATGREVTRTRVGVAVTVAVGEEIDVGLKTTNGVTVKFS